MVQLPKKATFTPSVDDLMAAQGNNLLRGTEQPDYGTPVKMPSPALPRNLITPIPLMPELKPGVDYSHNPVDEHFQKQANRRHEMSENLGHVNTWDTTRYEQAQTVNRRSFTPGEGYPVGRSKQFETRERAFQGLYADLAQTYGKDEDTRISWGTANIGEEYSDQRVINISRGAQNWQVWHDAQTGFTGMINPNKDSTVHAVPNKVRLNEGQKSFKVVSAFDNVKDMLEARNASGERMNIWDAMNSGDPSGGTRAVGGTVLVQGSGLTQAEMTRLSAGAPSELSAKSGRKPGFFYLDTGAETYGNELIERAEGLKSFGFDVNIRLGQKHSTNMESMIGAAGFARRFVNDAWEYSVSKLKRTRQTDTGGSTAYTYYGPGLQVPTTTAPAYFAGNDQVAGELGPKRGSVFNWLEFLENDDIPEGQAYGKSYSSGRIHSGRTATPAGMNIQAGMLFMDNDEQVPSLMRQGTTYGGNTRELSTALGKDFSGKWLHVDEANVDDEGMLNYKVSALNIMTQKKMGKYSIFDIGDEAMQRYNYVNQQGREVSPDFVGSINSREDIPNRARDALFGELGSTNKVENWFSGYVRELAGRDPENEALLRFQENTGINPAEATQKQLKGMLNYEGSRGAINPYADELFMQGATERYLDKAFVHTDENAIVGKEVMYQKMLGYLAASPAADQAAAVGARVDRELVSGNLDAFDEGFQEVHGLYFQNANKNTFRGQEFDRYSNMQAVRMDEGGNFAPVDDFSQATHFRGTANRVAIGSEQLTVSRYESKRDTTFIKPENLDQMALFRPEVYRAITGIMGGGGAQTMAADIAMARRANYSEVADGVTAAQQWAKSGQADVFDRQRAEELYGLMSRVDEHPDAAHMSADEKRRLAVELFAGDTGNRPIAVGFGDDGVVTLPSARSMAASSLVSQEGRMMAGPGSASINALFSAMEYELRGGEDLKRNRDFATVRAQEEIDTYINEDATAQKVMSGQFSQMGGVLIGDSAVPLGTAITSLGNAMKATGARSEGDLRQMMGYQRGENGWERTAWEADENGNLPLRLSAVGDRNPQANPANAFVNADMQIYEWMDKDSDLRKRFKNPGSGVIVNPAFFQGEQGDFDFDRGGFFFNAARSAAGWVGENITTPEQLRQLPKNIMRQIAMRPDEAVKQSKNAMEAANADAYLGGAMTALGGGQGEDAPGGKIKSAWSSIDKLWSSVVDEEKGARGWIGKLYNSFIRNAGRNAVRASMDVSDNGVSAQLMREATGAVSVHGYQATLDMENLKDPALLDLYRLSTETRVRPMTGDVKFSEGEQPLKIERLKRKMNEDGTMGDIAMKRLPTGQSVPDYEEVAQSNFGLLGQNILTTMSRINKGDGDDRDTFLPLARSVATEAIPQDVLASAAAAGTAEDKINSLINNVVMPLREGKSFASVEGALLETTERSSMNEWTLGKNADPLTMPAMSMNVLGSIEYNATKKDSTRTSGNASLQNAAARFVDNMQSWQAAKTPSKFGGLEGAYRAMFNTGSRIAQTMSGILGKPVEEGVVEGSVSAMKAELVDRYSSQMTQTQAMGNPEAQMPIPAADAPSFGNVRPENLPYLSPSSVGSDVDTFLMRELKGSIPELQGQTSDAAGGDILHKMIEARLQDVMPGIQTEVGIGRGLPASEQPVIGGMFRTSGMADVVIPGENTVIDIKSSSQQSQNKSQLAVYGEYFSQEWGSSPEDTKLGILPYTKEMSSMAAHISSLPEEERGTHMGALQQKVDELIPADNPLAAVKGFNSLAELRPQMLEDARQSISANQIAKSIAPDVLSTYNEQGGSAFSSGGRSLNSFPGRKNWMASVREAAQSKFSRRQQPQEPEAPNEPPVASSGGGSGTVPPPPPPPTSSPAPMPQDDGGEGPSIPYGETQGQGSGSGGTTIGTVESMTVNQTRYVGAEAADLSKIYASAREDLPALKAFVAGGMNTETVRNAGKLVSGMDRLSKVTDREFSRLRRYSRETSETPDAERISLNNEDREFMRVFGRDLGIGIDPSTNSQQEIASFIDSASGALRGGIFGPISGESMENLSSIAAQQKSFGRGSGLSLKQSRELNANASVLASKGGMGLNVDEAAVQVGKFSDAIGELIQQLPQATKLQKEQIATINEVVKTYEGLEKAGRQLTKERGSDDPTELGRLSPEQESQWKMLYDTEIDRGGKKNRGLLSAMRDDYEGAEDAQRRLKTGELEKEETMRDKFGRHAFSTYFGTMALRSTMQHTAADVSKDMYSDADYQRSMGAIGGSPMATQAVRMANMRSNRLLTEAEAARDVFSPFENAYNSLMDNEVVARVGQTAKVAGGLAIGGSIASKMMADAGYTGAAGFIGKAAPIVAGGMIAGQLGAEVFNYAFDRNIGFAELPGAMGVEIGKGIMGVDNDQISNAVRSARREGGIRGTAADVLGFIAPSYTDPTDDAINAISDRYRDRADYWSLDRKQIAGAHMYMQSQYGADSRMVAGDLGAETVTAVSSAAQTLGMDATAYAQGVQGVVGGVTPYGGDYAENLFTRLAIEDVSPDALARNTRYFGLTGSAQQSILRSMSGYSVNSNAAQYTAEDVMKTWTGGNTDPASILRGNQLAQFTSGFNAVNGSGFDLLGAENIAAQMPANLPDGVLQNINSAGSAYAQFGGSAEQFLGKWGSTLFSGGAVQSPRFYSAFDSYMQESASRGSEGSVEGFNAYNAMTVQERGSFFNLNDTASAAGYGEEYFTGGNIPFLQQNGTGFQWASAENPANQDAYNNLEASQRPYASGVFQQLVRTNLTSGQMNDLVSQSSDVFAGLGGNQLDTAAMFAQMNINRGENIDTARINRLAGTYSPMQAQRMASAEEMFYGYGQLTTGATDIIETAGSDMNQVQFQGFTGFSQFLMDNNVGGYKAAQMSAGFVNQLGNARDINRASSLSNTLLNMGVEADAAASNAVNAVGAGMSQQQYVRANRFLSGDPLEYSRFASSGMGQQLGLRPLVDTNTGLGIFQQEQWGLQSQQMQMSFAAQNFGMQQQQYGYNMNHAMTFGGSFTNPYSGQQHNVEFGRLAIDQAQFNLGVEQQQYGFDYQQRQLNISNQRQQTEMTIGHQQQQTQFGWQQQNWAHQENSAQLNFAWSMEDFDENIRFAKGRERRTLMRHRENAVVGEGMRREQSDLEKQRMLEQQKWAEEAYERQKTYFEENKKLQQERLDKEKEFFNERLVWQIRERDLAILQQKLNDEMQLKQLTFSQEQIQQQQQIQQREFQISQEVTRRQTEMQMFYAQQLPELLNNSNNALAQMFSNMTSQAQSVWNTSNMGAQSVMQSLMGVANAASNISNAGNGMSQAASSISGAAGASSQAANAMLGAANSTRNVLTSMNSIAQQIAQRLASTIGNIAINIQPWAEGGYTGDPSPIPRMFLEMPSYAGGGYTGYGAKHQPAGVVHKGEYVVPQDGALVIRNDQSTQLLTEIRNLLREILMRNKGQLHLNFTTQNVHDAVDTGLEMASKI